MAQNKPDDTEKRIRLVRYWAFGIFVLAIAAETAFLGAFTKNFGLVAQNAWLMWLLTLIVCALVFFGYPWWARRNK